MVIPGFVASDRTTLELRRALAEAGFRVHPWRLGWNLGARADLIERLKKAVDLCETDQPVLLVGWSLGGLFARELARADPKRVRAVVTLGTPIAGDLRQVTNVWRLYEFVARHKVDDPPIPNIAEKPPVPTLAIWSRKDGIIAVSSARGSDECRDKEVELESSHMAFAVSRTSARRAAREILAFLEEREGR